MSHSGNEASLGALERFLTAGTHDPSEMPALDALEASGLAAFASTLTGGGKMRRSLLTASARHIAVKAELQLLLRAWQEAGIEVLLFKGFHLAEFVYPTPGGRQYSDVDLLMAERKALEAAEVATGLGWRETWHAQRDSSAHALRSGRYRGHEVLQLLNERTGIQIDVHRRLVHNNHNRIGRYGRQERITAMTWQESQLVEWDDVRLRVPHPLDAVLVGLVLNRCWSPEDFELRSHDYLDFRFLMEKYGLRLESLRHRAEELGCPKTFELFLERCDPFRRHLVLSKPTRIELQRWNLLVSSERGNRYLERGWVTAREWPREVVDVLRRVPEVLRVLTVIQRSEGVAAAARELASSSCEPRELGAEEWQRLRRSVHRALRLVGYGSFRLVRISGVSKQDLEALALLAALHGRSCPATLHRVEEPAGDSRPLLLLEGKPLNMSGTLLGSRKRAVKPSGRSSRGRPPG